VVFARFVDRFSKTSRKEMAIKLQMGDERVIAHMD
jgi:hypothetical protein